MSTYKLTYFNGRGRAEVSRLIFAAAGQKYEDVRYERAQWPSHKAESPLGQIPYLEVDGTKIPQSLTIARFLAKQFQLAGKDNLEQAKVDAVADTMADFTSTNYTIPSRTRCNEKTRTDQEISKRRITKTFTKS